MHGNVLTNAGNNVIMHYGKQLTGLNTARSETDGDRKTAAVRLAVSASSLLRGAEMQRLPGAESE
jgi:hypothetical protein